MPTVLNLDDCKNMSLPSEYDITGVLGDVIMGEQVDVDDSGQAYVERDGILVDTNIQKNVWRVARAIMVGPDVKLIKAGDHFIYPNDKGITAVKFSARIKRPVIFLNEARIFCRCEPKKT